MYKETATTNNQQKKRIRKFTIKITIILFLLENERNKEDFNLHNDL